MEFKDVHAHLKACEDGNCQCHIWMLNYKSWESRLPLELPTTGRRSTWLCAGIINGRFASGCVVCADASRTDPSFTRAGVVHPDSYSEMKSNRILKFSSMMRHHRSYLHANALRSWATRLGIQCDIATPERPTAPDISVFRSVLTKFRDGVAPASGYWVHGCFLDRKKITRIIWCLFQAMRIIMWTWVDSAVCMSFMRDERKGRLHIRFCCSDRNAHPRSGFLGQSRGHTPDSVGINKATKAIIEQFCTAWCSPPLGCKKAECFNAELFRTLCSKVEAIAVDAAANEVTATFDVHGRTAPDHTLFKNLRWTLRDMAHAGRRILTRPWSADTVLDNAIQITCQMKSSPGQLIQHSHDHRELFKECVAEVPDSDRGTMSNAQNLSAAKHRFESIIRPLSRIILNISAIIMFACKVSHIHHGEASGIACSAWLEMLNDEFLVLIAMLADAGCEALMFIRFCDAEDVALSEVWSEAHAFLDRITWLYHSDGILEVGSHTKFIIKWLQTPRSFMLRNVGKMIGGGPLQSGVLRRCFLHLRRWTVLAQEVIHTEFPDFDLLASFSILSLSKVSNKIASVKPHLQRLGQAFKQHSLEESFFHTQRRAISIFNAEEKDVDAAWRTALLRSDAIDQGRRNTGPMWHVLQRKVTFTHTTSGIEHKFSQVDKKICKQRNMLPANENLAVALLSMDFKAAGGVDNICQEAARVWSESFGTYVRTHKIHRLDKGVKRRSATASGSTEGAFISKFHEDVKRKTPEGSSALFSAHIPQDWGADCQKERLWQQRQRKRRKIEAHINGILLPNEITEEVPQSTTKQYVCVDLPFLALC